MKSFFMMLTPLKKQTFGQLQRMAEVVDRLIELFTNGKYWLRLFTGL